jgi:MinD superfamily P-loop ATPase
MVFPELCHSCGGCKLVCPVQAITEKKRSIGKIYSGKTSVEGLNIVYGELKIGEPLAVPVISSAKEMINDEGLVIIDSPPGSACPVVESVQGADFCIMVTEPTPFGLHDLEIASEVVSQLGIPLGVVVNFAGIGDKGVYEFCAKRNIPILMEIPFDRRIAELYSQGIAFTEAMPEWRASFQELLSDVKGRLV